MTGSIQTAPLLALCEATIFTGEAMVEGHSILIQGGVIKDIVVSAKVPGSAERISCSQRILVPGFIDVQVNGGNNILLNNSPTPEACLAIARAHAKYGTTRLLLTCLTDEDDLVRKALGAVCAASQTLPNILGIHLEGPHLSVDQRGVHKSDFIRAMTGSDLERYKPQDGCIVLMTVAPENVSPESIRSLVKEGVIVSLGHTGANSDEIHAALNAGATGFTHLYNGMGGMSARSPGVAGIAIDDEQSWCGLIVDNYHVSPEMVRIAVRAKAMGKTILVSDAMSPAASWEPKAFSLYGEEIFVDKKRCVTHDGRLAGSAITLSDAVKNCLEYGLELEEVLRMASTYPAAFLGLDSKLGKILPDYIADIVAMDYQFNPHQVWVEGKPIA